MDLDLIIERLFNAELLSEGEIRQVCLLAIEIFSKESTVVNIAAPVTICGDIHGQFPDLLQLFSIGGHPPQTKYIFLGDYVDRGLQSTETICLLFALKVRYPDSITLLRGNHESKGITQVYGFYDECIQKYKGSSIPWKLITDVFDFMPLCGLIDDSIFAVHGGLSPHISHIDQINQIDRFRAVPNMGAMADLLWSDPVETMTSRISSPMGDSTTRQFMGWDASPRQVGHIFGSDITHRFNHLNGLCAITRAHQMVIDGYRWNHDGGLITLFSAPNYAGRCQNRAAFMKLETEQNYTFVSYHQGIDLNNDENRKAALALQQRDFRAGEEEQQQFQSIRQDGSGTDGTKISLSA